MAAGPDELGKLVGQYSDNPSRDREARSMLAREQAGRLDGQAGARVAAEILNLINEH
jgi:hypothetical protein